MKKKKTLKNRKKVCKIKKQIFFAFSIFIFIFFASVPQSNTTTITSTPTLTNTNQPTNTTQPAQQNVQPSVMQVPTQSMTFPGQTPLQPVKIQNEQQGIFPGQTPLQPVIQNEPQGTFKKGPSGSIYQPSQRNVIPSRNKQEF